MKRQPAKHPPAKHSQTASGFTLLEVLVALSMLATLTLILTLLVSQVIDAQDQLQSVRAQGQERLVDFLTRVDRPLTQVVVRRPHAHGQPLGQGGLHLALPEQHLYWVSGGQWVLPLEDYFTRLRLWRLRWAPEEERLYLESTGLLDAAGAHSWIQVDQLSKVTAIHWDFYHQQTWQNTLPADQRSLRALSLTLTWQGGVYQRLFLFPETLSPALLTGSQDAPSAPPQTQPSPD